MAPVFSRYCCNACSLFSSALRCSAVRAFRNSVASLVARKRNSRFCSMYCRANELAMRDDNSACGERYDTSTRRLLRTGATESPLRKASITRDCAALSDASDGVESADPENQAWTPLTAAPAHTRGFIDCV